ncbi:hypothetical protein MMC22_008151 [Lobaria immixta]|nr:hypothetical protein [Lobaria immixta]
MNIDPASYILWKRFAMPMEHGSIDAIAVKSSMADRLNSAYTILLNIVILQIWALIVLAGVFVSLRVKKPTHNNTMIIAGIWNTESPVGILKLTATYFWKLKSWELLPWILVAIIFLVIGYAFPIHVAPSIIIGHAAPVSPTAIYIPKHLPNQTLEERTETFALEVPAALRAAGSVQPTDSSIGSLISVDELETSEILENGERLARIGYRYSVSGLDFGLQRYPDLFFHVEGSCVTEYDWITFDKLGTNVYHLWNNSATVINVSSIHDGRKPLVFFQTPYVLDDSKSTSTNTSFAAVISSYGRLMIQAFPIKSNEEGRRCRAGRMTSGPIGDITVPTICGPKIVNLATKLGATALQSGSTALGSILDAGSASIHSDLERLVLASYIATKNVLTDTTLIPTGTIPNLVEDSNGNIFPGVADFVVRSSSVSTLSIRALIIFPMLSVALLLIVFLVKNLQSPWYKVHALQATVLYSCLDEMTMAAHQKKLWQRDSNVVFWEGDEEQACIGPRYDWKGDRKLHWGRYESSDNLREDQLDSDPANDGAALMMSEIMTENDETDILTISTHTPI